MADHSKIEWTDATWNPIGGCSIESPGCAPCYAQQLAGTRLKHHPLYAGTTTTVKGKPVFNGHLTVAPAEHPVWSWPVRWRGAKQPRLGPGQRSLIFVGDMSDLFHKDRPIAVVDQVVSSIINCRHISQLLTKRPRLMFDYFLELADGGRWIEFNHPLFGKPNFDPWVATFANVIIPRLWLGMSAERQREFDERWPWLWRLAMMGFTIFVSYEPAIGPLVLPDDFLALGNRAQVIAGGMSGRQATPAHPDWFRALRDQCAGAGVAFFFKQWGEWSPIGGTSKGDACIWHDGSLNGAGDVNRSGGAGCQMVRTGKARAGRLLDDEEHSAFPAWRVH